MMQMGSNKGIYFTKIPFLLCCAQSTWPELHRDFGTQVSRLILQLKFNEDFGTEASRSKYPVTLGTKVT